MNRFHIHITVKDLAENIAFYSELFGHKPVEEKQGYAKWMLNDPYINFAISSRGHTIGINHLGLQVDSEQALDELKLLADSAAAGTAFKQSETACCSAKREKHWTLDPQGIAWEHFITMAEGETFGDGSSGACCIPLISNAQLGSESESTESCCVANTEKSNACCG